MDRDSLKRVCSALSVLKLPATHAMVLLMADDRDVSMLEISQAGGFTTANATGIVDTMESKGLVERVHGKQDRRQVLVKINEPGEALLRQVMHQLKSI